MTPERIIETVRMKARVHPELSEPLRMSGLRRIAEREGVSIRTAPLPRPALLMQYWGRWTILINDEVPTRQHLYYATHELGHLWLHHDVSAERGERIYNMGDWEGDDPREAEVELFCTIVLGVVRYL